MNLKRRKTIATIILSFTIGLLLSPPCQAQGLLLRPQVGLYSYGPGGQNLSAQIEDYSLRFNGFADPPIQQAGLSLLYEENTRLTWRFSYQFYNLRPNFWLRNDNLPLPQGSEAIVYRATLHVHSFALGVSLRLGRWQVLAGLKGIIHGREYGESIAPWQYTDDFVLIYESLDANMPAGQLAPFAGLEVPLFFLTLTAEVQPAVRFKRIATPVGDFRYQRGSALYLFSLGYDIPLKKPSHDTSTP